MKKGYLSRKESIILSAIEIIDQMGISNLTIRELASRQGVSEAAIYRHFDSKNDILSAVLDHFSCFDQVIQNTILEHEMGSIQGIRFLVKSYAEYYENYPEITSILFTHDLYLKEHQIGEKKNGILEARLQFIVHLLNEGIEKGEILKEMDTVDLAIAFTGYVHELTIRWKKSGKSFNLKDRLSKNIDGLLNMVKTN